MLADRSSLLLVRVSDDLSHYDGVTVPVTRVVSGHTLEVDWPDSVAGRPVTQVRLWGVTAPHIASRTRPAQPRSDEAVALVRQLVEDQRVTLRLESQRTRDTFSRVLAHVEIPSGGTLNEALLEAGLAQTSETWPHSMLTRYAQAEQNARRRSVGIWADE